MARIGILGFEGDTSGEEGSTFFLCAISRAPWGKGAEFHEIYQSDATTSHKPS
jgi:hypothetical protein